MGDLAGAVVFGVGQACAWPAPGFLLVGLVVGALVGLMPGIGGPAMLAMLIPFTIPLSTTNAFALLMGAVSVLATTGDLSSILLGVPGEAVSAAMVLDGHAMARHGEAGRALGAALMSSLVGAVFGAVAFLVVMPIARPVMLSAGSPELFMFALAGIALIAPIAGRAPVKGLIAGALGLLLATVGLDSAGANPRFTFGSLFLWDGIGVVPMTLGLFAVPEAIALASGAADRARSGTTAGGGLGRGVQDTFDHWWLVLRCSAIGAYVGMLPGAGGSVAQWIAYGHARAGGTERPGAIEGVLGPGAANNASLGGALVPTVVFGIPGSITTAVLLAGLSIKGLTPGDTMLLPESQGGHLGFVISLLVSLVLANVLVVMACALLIRPLGRIAGIRGQMLVPAVLVLTATGAFMEKNAAADLIVVAGSGVLGWIMVTLDWPRPPLLLGLVLGPLAENRWRLSTSLYGWSWWSRPGVLVIAAVVVVTIASAVRKRREPRAGNPHVSVAARAPRRMPWPDVVFTLAIGAVVASAWALSGAFDAPARAFPRTIVAAAAVLVVVQLMGQLGRRRWAGAWPGGVAVAGIDADWGSARTAWSGIWVLAFFAVTWSLGFAIGAPLMVWVYLYWGAGEHWRTGLAQAGATAIFVSVLCERLLLVPLPTGVLLTAAGLGR